MEFKSDIRDIKFVAFEMLKVQELAATKKFAEATRETVEMVVDEGYKFARDVLAPSFETGDRDGCQFEGGTVTMSPAIVDGLKAWGEQGWSGIIENPEFGGQGLPVSVGVVLTELFTGAHCALSLLPMLTTGAAHLLERFGPKWFNAQVLEKMYSLEWGGTMCLTEPQAGSDVGLSKARARRVSDGVYNIVGTKNFISGGDHNAADNIIHILLARVEGAPAGTGGLSLFAIPKYRINEDGSVGDFNDVSPAGIEHKMGIHGTPTCTMNYGDNEDCIGYLIGEENQGMRLMFHLMNEARLWVGMQGQALGAAAYQQALDYARERLQGSDLAQLKNPEAPRVPILRHPDVRRMLLTMRAWTEAMRAMMYRVAWWEDKIAVAETDEEKTYYKGLVDLLTPVCKAYGSDCGFEVTSLGVQVLGGYGYCQEYPLEQLMRDTRIAAIYEGTNGIQAMDLFARKIPMKGGRLFATYMNDIAEFLKENTAEGAPEADVLESLAQARKTLQRTTAFLANLARENVGLGLLQATPYLRMFGHVACAFEMAREAVVARQALEAVWADKGADTDEARRKLYVSNADANFYQSKLHTARFFMNNILPDIYGLEKQLTAKDSSALDVRFGLDEEA